MNVDEPHTITGRDHPETSHEAAAGMRVRSGTARRHVVTALHSIGERGRTDEELQWLLGMSPSTERPRRLELVQAGYVVDTGARRPTASGARSIVWKITDAGRAALEADS